MIHDHALMMNYEKYDQQVRIQICKFIVLETAYKQRNYAVNTI